MLAWMDDRPIDNIVMTGCLKYYCFIKYLRNVIADVFTLLCIVCNVCLLMADD